MEWRFPCPPISRARLHTRLKGIKNISLKLLGTNISRKRKALGALEKEKTGVEVGFLVNTCFYRPAASQCMHAECSTAWPEIRFAVVILYLAVPTPALGNTGHREAVGAGRGDGPGYTLTLCPWPPRALGMGQPSLAPAEGGTHHGPCPTFPVPPVPGCSGTGSTAHPSVDAAPSPSQHHWNIPVPPLTAGAGWHRVPRARAQRSTRIREHHGGGGWSTSSFLQAPTPFPGATQHLLFGQIEIQPARATS